jgi:glutamine cyclotransferase
MTGRAVLVLVLLALLTVVSLVVVLRPAAIDSRATPEQPHAAAGPAPARYGFTVVNTYPHDPEAFTQGLLYRDGVLFESTGCPRGSRRGTLQFCGPRR